MPYMWGARVRFPGYHQGSLLNMEPGITPEHPMGEAPPSHPIEVKQLIQGHKLCQ